MKFSFIIPSLNEEVMINRFYDQLITSGMYKEYMDTLLESFNPTAISELVCRHLVSVGYDGRLYDCDFNQMLELQVQIEKPATIFNFDYEKSREDYIRNFDVVLEGDGDFFYVNNLIRELE